MMNLVLLVVAMVAISPFASVQAQTTEAEIQARLLHKPLFLRGQWGDPQLSFDATGHLIKKSDPVPFTLAGVDIKAIKMKSGKLVLTGERIGIVFKKDLAERVELIDSTSHSHLSIRIEIQSPTTGDWNEALTGIFLPDLAAVVKQMPTY